MKRRIYVASSWRNVYYPDVVAKLRATGHDVYDFRNPPSGDPGFKWGNVDPRFMEWSPEEYRDHLMHPKAVKQFKNDIEAMEACDTCVLVLPCGRSLAGVVPIQRQDGLLGVENRQLPISLRNKNRN